MTRFVTILAENILIAVAATLIFPGCRQDGQKNGTVDISHIHDLYIDTVSSGVNTSLFVDTISYIKLGPTPMPVAKVDKIKIVGSRVFVMDGKVSKSLFVFDSVGNFIYNINGPDKQLISDFCIDSLRKHIYVYFPTKHKIIKYAIATGKQESEVQIKGYFHELNMLDNNTFVLTRDGIAHFDNDPQKYNQNRICVFSTSGEYLKGYINTPLFPAINYGGMHAEYSTYSNSVNIVRLYSDTVYTLTRKGLEATYNLSLTDGKANMAFFNSSDVHAADAFTQSGKFAGIWGSFFETGDNILFYYTRKGSVNLFWQNWRTGRKYNIAYFENDVDMFPDIGMIKFVGDDKIVAVLPAIQILNTHHALSMVKNAQETYKKLFAICEGVTSLSNPIISVQHLKASINRPIAEYTSQRESDSTTKK